MAQKGLSQSNQPSQLSAVGFYAVKGHPKVSTCPGELCPGGRGQRKGPVALQALPSWVPLSRLRGPRRRFGGCLVWPQADAACPGLILLSQQTGLPELACPLFREALLNTQRGCGRPEGTCPAWEKRPNRCQHGRGSPGSLQLLESFPLTPSFASL